MSDNNPVNLRLLRDETRAQHEATEALLPLTDLGLDFQRYQQVLQCFYTFVHGWETWAAAHVPERLATLVRERQRAALLDRDLRFFGQAPAPDLSPDSGQSESALHSMVSGWEAGSPEYEAAFLGSMYVMEGSTLGGQYIARSVEESFGLNPGEGDAYFRGYGDRTAAMWEQFRQVLGAVPEEHSAIVIGAARVTFGYVQDVLRACPAASGEPASFLS